MAVAVVATFATAVPLTTATSVVAAETPAAAAAAAAEYVIPARMEPDFTWTPVLAAASGYVVKGKTPGSLVWRTYGQADGTPLVVPAGTTMVEAGPNSLAFVKKASGADPAVVTFRDMRNGAESVLTLPAGHTYQAVVGDSVLSSTAETGGALMHWLGLEGGQIKDKPITVLPAGGATLAGHSASGALLKAGGEHFFVTPAGAVRPAPGGTLAGDALFQSHSGSSGDSTYSWEVVWDTRRSLAAKDSRTVYGTVHGFVGSEVLAGVSAFTWENTQTRRQLFTGAGVRWSHALPGDRILVVGESGAGYGVHLVTKGADGKAVVTKQLDVPQVPRKVNSMVMDNGRLQTADSGTKGTPVLSEYLMPSAGVPRAGAWSSTTRVLDNGQGLSCTESRCAPTVATGDGGVVFAEGSPFHIAPGKAPKMLYWAKAQPGSAQASGRYLAYLRQGTTQPLAEVLDLDTGAKLRSIAAPGGTFALSGYWLWREKSAGVLEAVDVRTGAVVRTEKPADCDIKALDAWGTAVYWKCDGKSGVYNTSAKKNVASLPAHNTARLGLGFVAWEKDGVVKSTDFRGTTGTREIGRPADAVHSRGWTVDKYSGRIAYRDAGHNIHVASAGISATPNLSAIDREVPTAAYVGGGKPWQAGWFMNKSVSGWTLTLRAKGSGTVVRTLGDQDGRGALRVSWDGKDSSGKPVANGTYEWTLTAKPADGAGPELKQTGAVLITSGDAPRRDFTGGDGFGDLLTLDAKGELVSHQGDGKGGLGTKASVTRGWPLTATFVPFGQLDDDRCNDVLVRDAAGELVAYQGLCYENPGLWNPKSLGKGWNAYDVLTSAGDVTGDGRTDLLGRQASTGDLYLFAQDHLSGLKPGVKVSGGWKGYRQVVGAGDLNGDGRGDVLAVDAANTLWRFDGVGNGTFKARVQVNGAGWAKGRVQLIGVGDISGDGAADIVSRNEAGELLRNSGDGKGGLQATTTIATGFGGYKGIY
ncbi:FG-GAP-like repeat-containing protein [Streptomyces sp. NPDC048603]|uniref:FG-GAP-like repeat-containing protein n=1 Tax=Streptomyces sp. NPDC048603 TaxID=3365577 RepID=UPI0037210B16